MEGPIQVPNATNILRPAVSGSTIVWETGGPDNKIFYYDIHNSQEPIQVPDTSPNHDEDVSISGNLIVWTGNDGGTGDTYLYDISLGIPYAPFLEAAADTSLCDGQSTTLALQNVLNNEEAFWYDDMSRTTLLHTGDTYPEPITFADIGTSFWVVKQNTITGCESELVEISITEDTTCPVSLRGTAVLGSMYDPDTNLMDTILKRNNLLPLSQPYNTPPWNYAGDELVNTLPNGVVDWILVELREGSNSEETLQVKAAFLRNDGAIIDVSGEEVITFNTPSLTGEYYIIIRHRNHLDIMSSIPIDPVNITLYNFVDPENIRGGASQLQELAPAVYGLISGDIDGNGIITNNDFNTFINELGGVNEYLQSDCNLDGTITIADFNLYQPNASKIGISQVRY